MCHEKLSFSLTKGRNFFGSRFLLLSLSALIARTQTVNNIYFFFFFYIICTRTHDTHVGSESETERFFLNRKENRKIVRQTQTREHSVNLPSVHVNW